MAKARNEVGTAVLRILPSMKGFVKDLNRQIKEIEASLPTVKIDLEVKEGAIEKVRAQIESLTGTRDATIRTEAKGTKKAKAEIDAAAGDREAKIKVRVDDKSADRAGKKLGKTVRKLEAGQVNIDFSDKALDEAAEKTRMLGEIQRDIALLQQRMQKQMSRADRRAADRRMRNLRREEKLVKQIRTAQQMLGRDRGGRAQGDSLLREFERLGSEKEIQQKRDQASLNNNKRLVSLYAEQLRLKRQIGSTLKAMGQDEYRQQMASRSSDDERLRSVREIADIQNDMRTAERSGNAQQQGFFAEELKYARQLKPAVERMRKDALKSPVKVPLVVDPDVVGLQALKDSLRDVATIQDDIARTQLKLAQGADGDEKERLENRIASFRSELALRKEIIKTLNERGKSQANAGLDMDNLEKSYRLTLGEAELRRRILTAEHEGNEAEAAFYRQMLSNRRAIGDMIEKQAYTQRESEVMSIESDRKRLKSLRTMRQINLDMIKAKAQGDRAAIGRANAERNIRSAMTSDNGRKQPGVMMNYRGLTGLNLPLVMAAASGLWSMVAALGGIVAGAVAAAGALGVMGAVALTGASGVFKAFSDLRQANDTSSGQEQAAAAERQAAAVDRLQSAHERAADASKDLKQAQKDLGRAYVEATRDIRDQNMELQDAALSQEDAAIAVARAKQRLSEVRADRRAGKASALDVQEADLGVRQAQNRLRGAQNRLSDTRQDTAIKNSKGVEGSDQVTAAKDRIEDAARAQRDAFKEIASAQRELAQSFAGSNAALNRFNDTMAKLSPNARSFVNEVRALGDEWSALRFGVEQRMFEGLGKTFSDVAKNQLPELRRGMEEVAGTLNSVLINSLNRVDSTFTKFSQDGTFDQFLSAIDKSFSGADEFIDGFVKMLTTMIIEIGPSLGDFFAGMGVFLSDGAAMWGDFGAKTVDALTRLMPMFNRLMESMLPIAERALPEFEKIFSMIVDRFSASGGQMGGAAERLVSAFGALLQAINPLIPPFTLIVEWVARIFDVFMSSWMGTPLILMFFFLKTAISILVGASNQVTRLGNAMTTMSNAANNVRSGMSTATTAIGYYGIKVQDATAKSARFQAVMRGMAAPVTTAGAAIDRAAASGTRFGNAVGFMQRNAGKMAGIVGGVSSLVLLMGMAAGEASASTGQMGEEAGKSWQEYAMLGSTLAMMVLPALGSLGPVLAALGKGFGVAAKAARLLMMTLMANPVFLVIGAIVALGVALWAFFTKTETGRKLWSKFWNWLKNTVSSFIDWLKQNWPLILAILTGPIGLAIYTIVKNWDKIKDAFGAVVDWIRDKWNNLTKYFTGENLKRGLSMMWEGMKDGFKKAINFIIRGWNWLADKLKFKTPTWMGGHEVRIIPKLQELATGGPVAGAAAAYGGPRGAQAEIAPGGYVVNAKQSRKHRKLLESVYPGARMLSGPGTGTSDSIQGVYRGAPTAAVSAGEIYIPPGADLTLAAAVNGGANPSSENILAPGGRVETNAYETLGGKEWNNQWLNFFHNYTEEGKGFSRDVIDGEQDPNASPSTKAAVARVRARRDKAFQAWLDSSGNRHSYASGGLPRGVTLQSIERVKRNQEQIDRENKAKADTAAEKKKMGERHHKAWRDYLNKNGGWDNREAYWKRNPEARRRFLDGYFPPGDDSMAMVNWNDPSTYPSGDSTPGSGSFPDSSPGYTGSNSGGSNPFAGDGTNPNAGDQAGTGSVSGEPYGLPNGTNTGGYGSSGDYFPEWVHQLEQKFGVLASTYPGHQEDEKGAGFAPNPEGLNRGIDWQAPGYPSDGSVDAMHKFAEALHRAAPNVPGIEQIIWSNQNTGQTIGWGSGSDQSSGGYYAADWGGHQNHVHTRMSTSWDGTDTGSSNSSNATGAGNEGSWDVNTDPFPSDGSGTSTGSDQERDKGPRASTSIEDAMIDDVFSPKRFGANYMLAAYDATYDAGLEFFGLGNSVLNEDHEYWQALRDANRKWHELNDKKSGGDKPENDQMPNVGTGEVDANPDLMGDYPDPNGAPVAQLGGVGNLNPNSSKDEVAAAIIGEGQKRGLTAREDSIATVSTGLQESGLDPKAIGGGGAWHGVFQQDTSYPGRDDPNQNISVFFDRLMEKTNSDPSSDIWKRIFWLQQAPGLPTAEAAYNFGRQEYLTEIQSQRGVAEEMYERLVKGSPKLASGGWVSGPGTKRSDDVHAMLSNREFVTNADSADEAGPLLEFINSSPAAAREAMELLSGPMGSAVNSIAPGAGSAVAAALSYAGGAAEAGLAPVAAGAATFLSEFEKGNLGRRQAPLGVAIRELPGAAGGSRTDDYSVNYNGPLYVTDVDEMMRKQDNAQKLASIPALAHRR